MPYKDKKIKAEFQHQYMKRYRQTKKYKKRKQVYNRKEQQQKWYKKARKSKQYINKTRNQQLMKRYGITLEDYNSMFSDQEGKCAVCGKHQTELKRSLAVDHCHSTDTVRGLLCRNCNTAIGMLNDDIENLRCAILYLNRFQVANLEVRNASSPTK